MATRIFAAIYPPQHILDEAAALLDQVRTTAGLGLRWLPVEQWHITLEFYGSVSAGTQQEVQNQLHQITAEWEPFQLNLQGAGHFGHRTFWVGVGGEGKTTLTQLGLAARDAGERAGIETAVERAYTPHLSVARSSVRGRYRDNQAQRGYRRQIRQARKQGHDPAELTPPVLASDDMDAAVHALNIFRGSTFEVDSIHLVESILGEGPGGGALHHTIENYPLRGLL